jgi:hypothetical protein
MMPSADELQQALVMVRSADHRAVEAQRLARDARTVAVEAKESAAEAKVEAASANEGYRSVYFALGELAAEVSQIKTAITDLGQWVRRTVHDSIRPPAPSVHDIVEAVVEQSAGHPKVTSDRVREISREEARNARNARVAHIAVRVLEILAAAAAGTVLGHLWR